MDKNQREARRRQEDKAFNRGLLWVVGAAVLELLLLLVNRYYINFYVSEAETATLIHDILMSLRADGLLVCVVCLIWGVLRSRKGKKAVVHLIISVVCAVLSLCSHVTLAFREPGVQMLFLLVPVLAGLALVYYLYQREFFPAALSSGLSILGLWFIRYRSGALGPESILVLIALAALLGLLLLLQQREGTLPLGKGREVRMLPRNAGYWPALGSCAAGLAAMAAAVMLGGGVAYYLIFAMIVWLFGLLVYYTVKLM